MIGKFDSDADGARRGVEMWIDERDLSGKRTAGVAPHPHDRRLVLRHVRQIALGNIDKNPDSAVIGYAEKDITGSCAHSVAYVAFEYDAVAGRFPSEGEWDLPRFLNVSEHALGDGIVHQPLARTGSGGRVGRHRQRCEIV